MKPAENPLSSEGAYQGAGKSGKPTYSQGFNNLFTGKEIPRSLPSSEDGEKGVLCSLLLSPREVADICALSLKADAFYIPAHRTIYSLILEFGDKSKPIDFVSLKQALKDRNQLEEIGGPEYLSALYSFVPTAANASYYIEIVREKYVLRRLIIAFNNLSNQCYDAQEDIEPLLDDAEKEIFAITGEHVNTEIAATKDLVMAAIERIEKLYENRGSITGIPTGFGDLDRMTLGLHPAEMIVIAARPSMGKTALAMNIAEHVAINVGKAVAVFSLEMSSQQLVQRLLCSRAQWICSESATGFSQNEIFRN
jgi:replicative DNA helicase